MFNFYVLFAGQDMVTDAGRTTSCRPTFKTSWLQTKVQKMKDLSKTWVLTREQIEDVRQKKRKRKSRPFKNTQWNTRPLNVTTE